MPLERQRAILEEKEVAYSSDLWDIEPIAGVVAPLDFAEMCGLRVAVVTNAPRANAKVVLAARGTEERLPTVVVGSELPCAKANPLPYPRGLELIGTVAVRSVGFEEPESGFRADVAASLPAASVTTSHDKATSIQVGATLAVRDFTDPRIVAMTENRACPGTTA
jgi:beta-phosphoglucomutase-like phosphatase (HAD superfamily)